MISIIVSGSSMARSLILTWEETFYATKLRRKNERELSFYVVLIILYYYGSKTLKIKLYRIIVLAFLLLRATTYSMSQ